jgi:hypothetical protein
VNRASLPMFLACALPALLLAACISEPKNGCRTDKDCLTGRVCNAGTCQLPRLDASAGEKAETASVGDVAQALSDGREDDLPATRADKADVITPQVDQSADAPLGDTWGESGSPIGFDSPPVDQSLNDGSPVTDSGQPTVDLALDESIAQSAGGKAGTGGAVGSGGMQGIGGTTSNGRANGSNAILGTGCTAGAGGIAGSCGRSSTTKPDGGNTDQTVAQSAVSVANADFAKVPAWSDVQIHAQFRLVRTARFLYGNDHINFARRISWLYPDKGAEDRAELLASTVDVVCGASPCRPYKLFVFNKDASVRLKATIDSRVIEWDWHVAPVVKSATSGEVFVLDPTLEQKRPLLWLEWLLKMVPSLDAVVITVADSNAYDPDSLVVGGTSQRNLALQRMRTAWLPAEWEYQLSLGHEPDLVLGPSPPWGAEKHYVVSQDPIMVVPACRTCLKDIFSARCLADCP